MSEQDEKSVETGTGTSTGTTGPAADAAEKDLDEVVGGLRPRSEVAISDISITKVYDKSSPL